MTFKKYGRTNLTKICGEETIDEWVGRGVEGGEGLDEGGHGLTGRGVRDQAVHLEDGRTDWRAICMSCRHMSTSIREIRKAQALHLIQQGV